MKTYYKIMNKSPEGVKTLFHGNNGSRLIPMKEWVEASKYKLVTDGSSSTQYMCGWHVFEDFNEAQEYLHKYFKSFRRLHSKVIVKCHVFGNVRPKSHSRANVWLAQHLYLDEIVLNQEGDIIRVSGDVLTNEQKEKFKKLQKR